jgi:integrase/recombinase XerD
MNSVTHLFSISDATRDFIISLKASNRYKPKYLEMLEQSLAFLAEHADRNNWPPAEELTTYHREEYLAELSSRPKWFGKMGSGLVSQSYVETQYRRLKRFFNWMKQRGHIEENPFDLIPHPRIDERVIPTLSERELAILLKNVDPTQYSSLGRKFFATRDRAMLMLLIDTPGRRAELTSLNMGDVDIDQRRILVWGKGGRQRWMHLGAAAVEALWDYIQARIRVVRRTKPDELWVDSQGILMHQSWLQSMLHRLGDRAGIPDLHPRHTFAVSALRSGMPERLLMIEAGWRKIPETYFRTLNEEDAAQAHRLISPADKLGRSRLKSYP